MNDWCCTHNIPRSKPDLIIVRPMGKMFINGMTEQFSYSQYDHKVFEGIMTQREYEKLIERINDSFFAFFPCTGCSMCSYCCCPCTLGLSCIWPYIQVKDAIKRCKMELEAMNKELKTNKIRFELKLEKSVSYIKMYLPNHPIWELENG